MGWNLKESKAELEKQFYRFKQLSEKTKDIETDSYSIQNDMIRLSETIEKMKKAQQEVNDELSMIEAEQESYNGMLETINRELDANCAHLYRFQGENTVYEKAAGVSNKIGALEDDMHVIVRKLNENTEEPEPYFAEIEGNLDVLLDSLNWIESKVVRFR